MTTRDDVLDAIRRIERAGGASEATRVAQAALTLPLPEAAYDRILNGLGSVQPSPGAEQQGRAAQAMKLAEAALAHQLSASAQFDRQIIEALRQAHKTTVEGRRRLENLEAEIIGAAQAWDLGTASGAREFQRFLIAKLAEIIRVVEEANDDDLSKQALATALTALYAAQTDRAAPVDSTAESDRDPASPPLDPDGDADAYLDPLPEDEPDPGYAFAPQRQPEAPVMPMVPGLGGDGPGFGGMPAAMPAGLPPAGWLSDPDGGDIPTDDPFEPEQAMSVDDAAPAEGEQTEEAASSETPHDDGPVTVTLPDGATTTVADARLAAAMQAAAEGTPVAEAFRRQQIDIPPPGIPVTAPVDPARLRPGDIGVFTDRHAVAVGDGKALLDGQIHLAGNLRGPGFLGWQHLRIAEPTAAGEPAPTRPAGHLPGAASLKIRVPPVIVD
ncbi:DUF4226 domain-containing protein [Mycolicibacter kumamotonensis]|uniref:DUF4226 domain-containing protein n=1 Tax=Mycolicibacter kumamotonensis TaxID=354243 RepID=A0A1X0E4B7_9MYCO|nr:DUF4226 domain-containing protein [Mycolicibacter kumamotonensis]NDJ89284.1 DUF4226 domain-containing protein [Mycolicibacter kumamotonensis]ORA78830.1 hypothetical protein BST28_13435 [Mycolicibacter kumamotonensis]